MVRLRDYLNGTRWQKLEVETLRRRFFKIGVRGQQSSRRIWIHFASSYPEQELFSILIQRLCPTYQNNKAKVTPSTFFKD